MKAARLVVLGIALVAGLGAAMLAGGGGDAPPAPVADATPLNTVDVLVAAADIPLGSVVKTEDVRWQAWPQEAANAQFLQKPTTPQAIETTTGSIARSPFVAGEPIRADKLIKGNGSGYMAAILPAGMRAISIEISPETGAGGFILPNDRVDVILTRRQQGANGRDETYSETIGANVRVLAIDQAVEDKDGQRVVVGKTATLELSPVQTEQLALSRQLGTLSLALRSLADSGPSPSDGAASDLNKRGGGLTIVRFGVASQGGAR
ncbi:pilus assembly protein CpaB [Methylopila capsulata]|uniref:Pilus assembly protein CpaB n=1 Tax=Methylopila capsulata TaxID=61654 RepID=A0A9W6ISL1_9HYPH|nr:Flp pilus assembly protein CpaB [Methylopila capsulata]MBM7851753.1 pilus assembly protein CpaB [Methylopila capsulata]GLK54814.1 Flp pilus assembly protein CpaB [Methylopila capsulata]